MIGIRGRFRSIINLVFASAFVFLAMACAREESNADPVPAPEVVAPPSDQTADAAEEASGDRVDAQVVLAAALAEAAATDRLVFLHSGAEWCGWCKRLEAWMVREDIAPIFFKDFVDARIMEEMDGFQELIDAYKGDRQGGFPWMAILDPDGNIIVTSNAPNGRNIGSPQAEWEIEHWNTMMRTAAKRITEEEIQYMGVTLAEDRGTP